MGKAQGFSRDERLRRTKDFDRVFAEGTGRKGRLMAVRCLPNGLPCRRLGVALGRGWKRAAARNRAKRLIREAFRTHKAAMPQGIDVIVIPWSDWGEPDVEAIARELVSLACRAAEGQR